MCEYREFSYGVAVTTITLQWLQAEGWRLQRKGILGTVVWDKELSYNFCYSLHVLFIFCFAFLLVPKGILSIRGTLPDHFSAL